MYLCHNSGCLKAQAQNESIIVIELCLYGIREQASATSESLTSSGLVCFVLLLQFSWFVWVDALLSLPQLLQTVRVYPGFFSAPGLEEEQRAEQEEEHLFSSVNQSIKKVFFSTTAENWFLVSSTTSNSSQLHQYSQVVLNCG